MPDAHVTDFWDQYSEAWDDREPEAVMGAFAPAGEIHDPGRDEPMTGEEIGEWVASMLAGFPDVHFEEHRRVTNDAGDTIIVEWTMHGTHTGPFEGLPPTDRQVELDGVDIVTASEEGIESMRIYFDQSSIADQLGLSFPAVLGQLPKLVWRKIRMML